MHQILVMKYITTKDATTGEEIELSYKDYGQGRPVILIHGWPSSKDMWEYQIDDLVNAGLRVIKYDRRGFGKSSKPWNGYDYDTLTEDLNAIVERKKCCKDLWLDRLIAEFYTLSNNEHMPVNGFEG